MRIAALGRTRILFDTITQLVADGHTIPLIATCPAAPEHDLGSDDFARLARELGAEFFEARSLDRPAITARLQVSACELAVSVNWLTRIGAAARASFPRGILNAHGGDLPRYRGNAPFAWAILNGELSAGITIHEMDDDLDTGPIYLKRFVPITPETYVGDLYRELAAVVPAMFAEVVAGIADGRTPVPQVGEALRGYPRRPEDATIDWRHSAAHLARLVRASSEPFDGAFTRYGGQRLTIWRARAVAWLDAYCAVPGQVLRREPSGAIAIATGDGVLQVLEVQLAGGNRAAPAGIVRSLRERLG